MNSLQFPFLQCPYSLCLPSLLLFLLLSISYWLPIWRMVWHHYPGGGSHPVREINNQDAIKWKRIFLYANELSSSHSRCLLGCAPPLRNITIIIIYSINVKPHLFIPSQHLSGHSMGLAPLVGFEKKKVTDEERKLI